VATNIDLVIALAVGPRSCWIDQIESWNGDEGCLNIISTGAMVALGKVRGNLMIDLHTTSAKLRDRRAGRRRLANAITSLRGANSRQRTGTACRSETIVVAILQRATNGDPLQKFCFHKRNGPHPRRTCTQPKGTLCCGQYS
jgi:N-acetylmuramic acid 6-phosphate (MurNAc-6-P) etherase